MSRNKCRAVLEQLRADIRRGNRAVDLNEDAIIERIEGAIFIDSQPGHIRVVNATGTILHTNLGRALLPRAAIDAMLEVADHPINLEYDLAAGKRGKREETLEKLLTELTGAEAATVVNNNAAAVLLGLNTLAEGKEVIVSRGELIEIGGAFRIPEIMAKSGAICVKSAPPIAPTRQITKTPSTKKPRCCSKFTRAIIKWSASPPK